MEQHEQPGRSNILKTLLVYLGGAWVFIEAINFLIDKYDWNTSIVDILILLVIFGLPALLIYASGEEQQLWVQDFRVAKDEILNFYNDVTKTISEEINIVLSPREESMLARALCFINKSMFQL